MTRSFIRYAKKCAFALLAFPFLSLQAQNPITIENALPGNPPSQWDISGAGDLSIQGFATDISVNKGQTIHFKINTDASAYNIDIYRLGYYQGNGARKVGTGIITAALPQTQPTELYDDTTGLTDCGNWLESAHWDVPASAVSGLYIARLTRTDNGGASHIVFIVRDDASSSELYFQTSDATWQAYNVYGGNSLYVGSTSYPSGHATKVSYNRPFITRNGGGGGGAEEDWLFNAEYPMIRWLERNGYDVSYTTCVDADRYGSLILNHKIFLSVGHDEYWSGQQYANVTAARDAGVHLAFFSGNEIYWKTRWENSTDGANSPYRTLVCYKEGYLGENSCGGKCDPLPTVWTGLWRDGCSYPAADGCQPENALSGQISWDGTTGAIEVPATYKNLRFWRNTGVAALSAGQSLTLVNGTLGYEWDWNQFQSSYARGRIQLSSTLLNTHEHNLSLYRAASGALVFGAGTVQWSWGLDGNHDRGNTTPSADMQQATVNLLADMGAQPATLQSGLIAASTSSDTQAPVSVITTPSGGALLANGVNIVISGTASDNATVAGVDISVDGGTTWLPAAGTNVWTFTWTSTGPGPVTIMSRAFDDSGNMETATNGFNTIIDTVSAPGPVVCPCTLFQPSDTPGIPLANDNNQGIELGMKFKSGVTGYITGVRYYKGAGGSGTHLGHIWNNETMLAEATFTNESSSGWQQASFIPPIQVEADSVYTISCFSSSGDYAYTDAYFTTAFVNGPLTGLADGQAGANGVYKYSQEPTYPTNSYQASNYWVDVVFETSVGPDTTLPRVIGKSPAAGAINVGINSSITATFNEAIDVSTLNVSTFVVLDPSSSPILAAISYNSSTRTAVLVPSSPLAYSTTYTVIVKGGAGYQRIKDIAGNAMLADQVWSFTTGAVPPPPPVPPIDGPGGPILVIGSSVNPFSRYTAEILRAEGFNEFDARDILQVSQTTLDSHEVVILGEIALTPAQVTLLSNWVNSGGVLIAFKPDAQLSSLLGITATGSTLSDQYLLVDTSTAAGHGIVAQTIQFHGSAGLYSLNGAASLATLYSSATAATAYPAVTLNQVGTQGGQAIAFTYDLPRSVVYTRQGNPAWAAQKRDGQIDPIRSDDMFYPDWIDMNKVAIPQADEQQHLLSNLILQGNMHHKPLPRLWFLPKGLKAAVIMTGDNHGDAGMQPRFDINIQESTAGCSVDDWECIRSTGYLYVGSNFTDTQAKQYSDMGFEVALHVNTNCANFTPAQLNGYITSQFTTFSQAFPSIPLPVTNRTHCIAWSDWSGTPETEAALGVRLDVNYYYWPEVWVNNQPGMFTGSGMPMRFAKTDGTLIDCYQATTQMPDESGETFPQFCDALLDKALGAEGYYGVFTTNMHFDNANHPGANAIVASAKARGVPVVTARQMLTWLDGRNNSSFNTISWNLDTLSFGITAASGSRNMQAMLPAKALNKNLLNILFNGSATTYTLQTIKGTQYAFFGAGSGNYKAIYGLDTNNTTSSSPCAADVTSSDFGNGTPDSNTMIAMAGDGEIILKPAFNDEFSGTALPAGWQAGTWNPGGSVTLGAGQLTADGASASALAAFGPGSSLEFVATFQSATFQNLGFAADASFNAPWVTIGQGNTAGSLSARTDDGTTVALGSSLAGSPHYYRIDWTPTSFVFYVDSVLVTTISKTVSSNMVTMISDFNVGGGNLLVDWLRVTPYASAGSYTSKIFDYGDSTSWGAASWTSNVPAGTSLNIFARTGNVSTPDGTWSAFLPLGNGSLVGRTSRYIQYRADLATTNPALTPALYDLSINCSATPTVCTTPQAYISAVNAQVCAGTAVQLQLDSASGSAPFKLLVNGVNYTNVQPGQTFATINTNINSIWGNSGSPVNPNGNDGQPIEVGTKFRASVSGYVTGVRFYKGAGNTGTHTGSLWNKYGTRLATATYTAETASGWQEVRFATPVFIWADSTYIASYYSPNGGFAISLAYFATSGVSNGPLTALQTGADGVNGVYVYGGGFPSGGNNANYWADVLFMPQQSGVQTQSYTLTSITANNNCSNTGAALSVATVTLSPLPAGVLDTAGATCKGQTVNLVYNSLSGTGPFTLNINGTNYTGINSGVPFNTGVQVSPQAVSIWGNSITPGTPSQGVDSASIELGVKFRAATAGKITGIRFYKGAPNTGTHTGSLWSSSGILLATATFSSETSSGWQEVYFSSPVTISANTTYIASYHAPNGRYAFDAAYFTSSGYTNGYLKALQNGEDGLNALYTYSSSTAFPTQSFNSANYWVDVLFESSAPAGFLLSSVTDAGGCTAAMPQSTLFVTGLDSVKASLAAFSNISCKGLASGSATVTATGGTGSYTYLWNDSLAQTTAAATQLKAGAYTVTVNDVNGCNIPATATITLTEPAQALSIAVSHTDAACYGASTGAAAVSASGGTAPYAYAWLNAVNNDTLYGAAAGNYTITVTDANSCAKTGTVTIGQASQIIVQTYPGNINCYGSASGTASVTVSGGQSPYTYLWNTGATTTGISSLAAGTYTVQITDANLCLQTATVIITQPASALSVSVSSSNALCYGDANGSAAANAAGGTAPYTYSWSNGSSAAAISQVPAGSYTVTVTDNKGCIAATQTVVSQASQLTAQLAISNIACFGQSTGNVKVFAGGGTPVYTYAWSNGSTLDSIANLSAGTYSLVLGDQYGCTLDTAVTISQPASAMSLQATETDALCHGDATGTASVTAQGGTAPYTYLWLPGGYSQPGTSAIAAGNYTVTVTDLNGCAQTTLVAVNEPAALSVLATATDANCNHNDGTATALTAGGSGSYTYLWSDGLAQTNATATGLAPGNYSVIVTDGNNCTNTETVTVANNAGPQITVTADTYTLCAGSSANLSAGGATNYLWWPAGGLNATTGSQVTATPAASITYWVKGTDGAGCSDSTSLTITVNALPATPTITANGNVMTSSATSGNQWNLNGVSINGATGQTYTAVLNGNYVVTVTDGNGCSASSAAYPMVISGVSTQNADKNVRLYPNPVSGVLNIAITDGSETVTLDLYTVEGKLLMQETWNTDHVQTKQINMQSLSAGVYYAIVKTGDTEKHFRIMVE